MLKRCFYRRILISANIDKSIDNWNISKNRLTESFIQGFSEKGISKIGVINLSINDFLRAHIVDDSPEKNELEKSIVSIKQLYRLINNADDFVKEIAMNGSIFDFEFEYPKLKSDYIVYCIVKYNIRNTLYIDIVGNYFRNLHDIEHYEKSPLSKINVIIAFLQQDLISFYGIKDYLFDIKIMDLLFNDLALDDMISILNALEPIIKDVQISRDNYLQLIKPYFIESVGYYTTDIDAADASDGIDIKDILNSYWDYYNGFNSYGAEDELEEIIKSYTISDLCDLLDTLPKDISQMINVDKDISISVTGVGSVIESYMEPDYDDYEGHSSSVENNYDEIDYIFDR